MFPPAAPTPRGVTAGNVARGRILRFGRFHPTGSSPGAHGSLISCAILHTGRAGSWAAQSVTLDQLLEKRGTHSGELV